MAVVKPPVITQTRRDALATLLGAGIGAAGAAIAQEARRYAVLSLLGDELVLVYAAAVTGSNVDSNRHRAVPDPAGGFDKMALSMAGRALEAGGGSAALISIAPSPLHQNPERLFDGADIALPDAWVEQIDNAQATHVVLLTKLRGRASIPLADGHVGVGNLRGLGYYVDRMTNLEMAGTGATGQGMIAAYAYMRLTLADGRTGRVLKQRSIQAARPYAVAQSTTVTDPWELLKPDEKVSRLRVLLEGQLTRELPALVAV